MSSSISSRAWVALAALALSLPVGFAGLGQLLPLSTPVIIDDGASAPAFQTTGTWVTLALPGNAERDSLRYATKGSATWTASVRPGTYAIEVSIPPILRIVQQAYSVTDGSSVIGTFVVPRLMPGEKKPQSNWIRGATVSTSNGTVAVTLTVPASIGVADAVRIVPVSESSSSSSVSLPPPPLCGNGSVEGSEQCDYGSANGQPCMAPAGTACTYCSASCIRVTVDGIRPSSSSSSAPAPACGNGSVEGSEQCDDGYANGRICDAVIGGSCTYCSGSCVRVVVDGPRPSSSSSSMSSSVPASQCGNGLKESGEQCDAGSANGRFCEAAIGGSCTYCSSTCVSVIVDGPKPSSSSMSSAANAGSCSDGIDGDIDGGADVASLTDAFALGTKNSLSVISHDVAKNVTYFMQQGESNDEQTIEARDAHNAVIATKKFRTADIRRDVFGSPAIDAWAKLFTKPYFSHFTTANGSAVFGLVNDSTFVDVIIGTTGKSQRVRETKVVRFSSDLSTIEAVLSSGSDRIMHGYLYPTPDGKSLVLFAAGMVKRIENPNGANEYAAPFVLVIDAETFTVKSRYSVATSDFAIPYPLFVGNDTIVFALNAMKLSGVGIYTSVERFPVQVIEYVPSTGIARVVEQPFNGMLHLPGDPRAHSDGSSAYMVALRELRTPTGVRTVTPQLVKISLSTLLPVATLDMPTDFGSVTKILRVLSNGYLATLRIRFVRDGVYDQEILLFDLSKVAGTVAEQPATVQEGGMLRTQDGVLVRTNRSVPLNVSYDQMSATFYKYDTTQSMSAWRLKHDAQCTSPSAAE
jgi:hypothetical protein